MHRDLIFGNHLELETHSAQHNYPTRTRNDLVRAQTRTNVAFKFITSSGVSLYNSIPDYCKNCEDVAKFKILYKKSLLDNYSRWIILVPVLLLLFQRDAQWTFVNFRALYKYLEYFSELASCKPIIV